MPTDSVVAEVRAAREAYAARFGFDLEAMARDLRELERSGKWVVLQPPAGAGVPSEGAAGGPNLTPAATQVPGAAQPAPAG